MKKVCLLLVMVLVCSLFMVPGAFAEDVEIETIYQDDFGRLQLAGDIQPRYQACCLNGPSLVWRTTRILHVVPTGGGLCRAINYVGDQYCQLCGHVWQSEYIYKTLPGCGLYHY